MIFEFRLPDIGEGMAEGEVVQWFVHEGDSIREDTPLVSVLTDKANVEIPSPKAGKIVKIHAQAGEKVKVGGLLVSIETAGSGSGPASAPSAPPASAPPTAPAAPATVPAMPAAPAGAAPPAPPTKAAQAAGKVLASPFLRKKAAELGVDIATVSGTGAEGRVTESDLERAAGEGPVPPPAKPAPPTGAPPGEVDRLERVPIRGIRRVISEHMARSVHTAAHFTYVEEVDASELVRFRDRMAKHVEKQGIKLSYLPFIVKGVIAGLRAHPRLNATMDDERGELLVHSAFHIGIATATPEGLLVPVVRRADAKSVASLAREIQDLGERARQGKLTREELQGSTFTITSLGALGGVMATPILNYPEVGILGVHKIQRRPSYRPDGSLAPADLMNLSVSLDHRVLDGVLAAQFLAVVKSYLEDPHQLFAEMA